MEDILEALAIIESHICLHHGSAMLSEDGGTFDVLDNEQAIKALHRARCLITGQDSPEPVVVPARDVLGEDFWPSRDLSRFLGNEPESRVAPTAS